MWLTTDQQRVWRSYLTMVTAFQRAMNRQLQADCGITLGDYDILVALSERGTLRVFELSETLAWEQSRLSHQLRRMRDRGLITREGSNEDRRGATVSLTPAGRAALEAAAPGHVALVQSVMFDGVGVDELRVLERWTTTALSRLAVSYQSDSS
ncbi:MarR family winged helix-turn-helix transcriptional regulator [Mycolicibacterium mengxianglii]|uniref:MarR family winged helix-turn-helix transcriptional regulator n=1 Tax=Mycolicibacterium mengxianglii TaxID=2736649 RepID=UPI0018D0F732|nr:MarR family winged helix-turn-helix transcriptional regulator [Mycolicibacterium mengxianglii]